MAPLTKDQQALRGRELRDMSPTQLRDWIEACEKMERSVKFKKSRRAWKQSREQAVAELECRNKESSYWHQL